MKAGATKSSDVYLLGSKKSLECIFAFAADYRHKGQSNRVLRIVTETFLPIREGRSVGMCILLTAEALRQPRMPGFTLLSPPRKDPTIKNPANTELNLSIDRELTLVIDMGVVKPECARQSLPPQQKASLPHPYPQG